MMRAMLAISAGLLCALAGLRMSCSLRQEAVRLRRWTEVLRHLSLLLEQRQYALPTALMQAATAQSMPDQVLRQLAEGMRRSPLTPLPELFGRCAVSSPEQPALSRLMPRLSHGTLPERTQAVSQAAEELQMLALQAEQRAERDVKLWRTLGLTGGACLTLLLL